MLSANTDMVISWDDAERPVDEQRLLSCCTLTHDQGSAKKRNLCSSVSEVTYRARSTHAAARSLALDECTAREKKKKNLFVETE